MSNTRSASNLDKLIENARKGYWHRQLSSCYVADDTPQRMAAVIKVLVEGLAYYGDLKRSMYDKGEVSKQALAQANEIAGRE